MIDKSQLDKAISFLSTRITQSPAIAVVLGSGLGDFADHVVDSVVVEASSIPNYPISTVQGHEGKLIFGKVRTKGRESLPLLIFKGRVHYFESGDLNPVTFPVFVAGGLGARYLLTTNAAGGINPAFAEGDLMLMEDFLNLAFVNPHRQIERFATTLFRTECKRHLDEELCGIIRAAANDLGITLRRGTYCWLKGPSYETKAEIEMLRRIGADAVGMSTVPEIIAGAEIGMRVAAVSLISNLAAGLTEGRLSHEEVAETANRVKQIFAALLKETILRIKN